MEKALNGGSLMLTRVTTRSLLTNPDFSQDNFISMRSLLFFNF